MKDVRLAAFYDTAWPFRIDGGPSVVHRLVSARTAVPAARRASTAEGRAACASCE